MNEEDEGEGNEGTLKIKKWESEDESLYVHSPSMLGIAPSSE
jgi:hypothetical protein